MIFDSAKDVKGKIDTLVVIACRDGNDGIGQSFSASDYMFVSTHLARLAEYPSSNCIPSLLAGIVNSIIYM